jgi:hypothetical protein
MRQEHRGAPARQPQDFAVRVLLRLISIIHGLMAMLFAFASIALIGMATHLGWSTVVSRDFGEAAAQGVIEAIGLLAAAVVALQIAQTIAEEEVIREAHVSGPTRVPLPVSFHGGVSGCTGD